MDILSHPWLRDAAILGALIVAFTSGLEKVLTAMSKAFGWTLRFRRRPAVRGWIISPTAQEIQMYGQAAGSSKVVPTDAELYEEIWQTHYNAYDDPRSEIRTRIRLASIIASFIFGFTVVALRFLQVMMSAP